ncbi:GNAT family N-acetyltransferase [Isoptericola sp. BMS4]|nr:GNAT family N-acetyltransferase [Isoptericola sp. BMS4]
MILGEEYARARGARSLGLNVFGFNTAARALYESLGFETAAVTMHKRLR